MLSNTGYHIEPGKEIFMKIEKSEVGTLLTNLNDFLLFDVTQNSIRIIK